MRTPPRILIVDDTPANVHILQTRLAASGYDIVTATDGEAALAAVRETQPDLILLDVMMPKMDGFEVCRRLRSDASLPFIPIIMVTAKADPKERAPVDVILRKLFPVNPNATPGTTQRSRISDPSSVTI